MEAALRVGESDLIQKIPAAVSGESLPRITLFSEWTNESEGTGEKETCSKWDTEQQQQDAG